MSKPVTYAITEIRSYVIRDSGFNTIRTCTSRDEADAIAFALTVASQKAYEQGLTDASKSDTVAR